jgi:pilus assembly protein CpaC
MVKGEPFLDSRLADQSRGRGLAAILREGTRAMAVKVDQVIGVAGFVQPGDYVDVITTMKPDDVTRHAMGDNARVSKIILQDIRVLAAGEHLSTEGHKPVKVQVVTLEVTPEQSERLALASQHGSIQLTMRSHIDQGVVATAGVTPLTLLAGDDGADKLAAAQDEAAREAGREAGRAGGRDPARHIQGRGTEAALERRQRVNMRRFVCALLLLALGGGEVAFAAPKVTGHAEATESISLQVGETRLLRLSEKIIRISVADPDVADVQVVTPLQVLITAKTVGSTHISLWGTSDEPLVMAVSASRNLDQLRAQLKELFPNEKIHVGSAGELVVLSGEVSDLRLPARAAELAGLYSDKLANLIKVSGDQQVELDVRFAEVSRTGLRKLGLNFLWSDAARGYVGGQTTPSPVTGTYLDTNQLHVPGTGEPGAPGTVPFVPVPDAEDAFNLFFATGLSKFPFSSILTILSQEGLAKVLAEPTLVALSGEKADFHAGGEVPLLIARQLGEVSVEYKKFGVQLGFVPTVLGGKMISLELKVEVSEPDPSSGATLAGFSIPGFRTRSTDTTIRLKDGQSFAIAGLLSDNVRSTVNKLPVLGDIPILGALFRSTAFQHQESELLVVVKARLVRPLEEDEVPELPGENELTDPTDFELFLLGRIDPEKKERAEAPLRGGVSRSEIGPTGPIGFEREP